MFRAKTMRDDPGARFGPAARSAFRTLGLAASASQAEVFEAAEALRLALRLGVEKRFAGDLVWLGGLARAEADVRDALGRLADPPRRAAERLFWFHAPCAQTRPASVEALRRESEALVARGGPAPRHDAALLLLAGLHALDPRFKEPAAWARAFDLWRELVEAEEFWSLLVAADLRGEFEQVLTFAEAAELRAQAPRLVSKDIADAAASAAAAQEFALAGRALDVLRGVGLPPALIEEYENDILGPARENAEQLCDEAFARSRLYADLEGMLPSSRKRMFDGVVHQYNREVKPELLKLLRADGPRGFHLRRALDHAAAWLVELAGRYREEGWPGQATYLYREARALAPAGTLALDEAEAALREMGAETEARNEEEEFAAVARELSPRRLPAKLFPEDKGTPQKEDSTGCLVQIAFYALVVVSCFALNECGIINTKRPPRTLPPTLSNYNFRGPAPQFSPIPFPSLAPYSSVPTVTAAELRGRMRRGQVVVVDARGREEYEAGHIAGALSVPQDEADGHAAALRRRGRQVVCYGSAARPWSAQIVALSLRIAGLKQVAVLEGGFEAWVAEGLPTQAEAQTIVPPTVVERAAPPVEASPAPTPSP
jgi:rhodanese-related sulfurtransferase